MLSPSQQLQDERASPEGRVHHVPYKPGGCVVLDGPPRCSSELRDEADKAPSAATRPGQAADASRTCAVGAQLGGEGLFPARRERRRRRRRCGAGARVKFVV